MSSSLLEFQAAIGEGESEFADEEKDRASEIPVATILTDELNNENYAKSVADDQVFFSKPSSPVKAIESIESHILPRVINHKHKPSLEEEPLDVDQTSYLSFLPSAIISDIQGANGSTSPINVPQGQMKPVSDELLKTININQASSTIDSTSTGIKSSKAWSLQGLHVNGPRKYYSLSSDSEYDYYSDQQQYANKQHSNIAPEFAYMREYEYELENENQGWLPRAMPLSKSQGFYDYNPQIKRTNSEQYSMQGKYAFAFNAGTHFPANSQTQTREFTTGKESEGLEMSGSESENMLYNQENYPTSYKTPTSDYYNPYTSGSDSSTPTGTPILPNSSPSRLKATSASFQSQKKMQVTLPPFTPGASPSKSYSPYYPPRSQQYYYYEREGFIEYEDKQAYQNMEGELNNYDRPNFENASYHYRYPNRNPTYGYVPKKKGVTYVSPNNIYIPAQQNSKVKSKLKNSKYESISNPSLQNGSEEVPYERPKLLKTKSFPDEVSNNYPIQFTLGGATKEDEQKKRSTWKVKYPQPQNKLKENVMNRGDSDASTGASLPASASVSPESVSPPSEAVSDISMIAGQKVEDMKVEIAIEKILNSAVEQEPTVISLVEKIEMETPKQDIPSVQVDILHILLIRKQVEVPPETLNILNQPKSPPPSPKRLPKATSLKKEAKSMKKEAQFNNKVSREQAVQAQPQPPPEIPQRDVSPSPSREKKPPNREIKLEESPKPPPTKKESSKSKKQKSTPSEPKEKERSKAATPPIPPPVVSPVSPSTKPTTIHTLTTTTVQPPTSNSRSGYYPNLSVYILAFMGIFTSLFISIASNAFCTITDCSGQPHISFQIYLAFALIIYTVLIWLLLELAIRRKWLGTNG